MTPEALVFDAYGTLFDVHSVQARAESLFPGKGAELSRLWRTKQLEYTWLRSLMRRYAPFSTVTREALAYACEALGLELTAERMEALMGEYLMLATFPEVPQAMERLAGRRLAILSNGSPDMLEPVVRHSGLALDAVLSVDEVKVYNYGHLHVTFDDGSVGWYEAAWGPMISETAFFVKDVMSPKGSVSKSVQ